MRGKILIALWGDRLGKGQISNRLMMKKNPGFTRMGGNDKNIN